MRHFPIFVDLRGRTVLVLGQGETAERKAAAVRAAGATIRHAARFCLTDLHGCALAIGADAPEDDLAALSAAAQQAGIPVNVVDRPALCSFLSPAIVERDPLTIAISSGGAAPVLARLIRARIEAAVPPAFGRLAAIAEEFKDALRSRFPDMAARRKVLARLLDGPAAAHVFDGDEARARAAFAAALGGAPEAAGAVYLVGAGPGAADLATLRAQRLLGEADVVARHPDASAEVAGLARRDAALLAEPDVASVAALVRAGKRVVWLLPGDGRAAMAALAEALAAAGLTANTVPGVG